MSYISPSNVSGGAEGTYSSVSVVITVSNSSTLLEWFRVRVETGTEPWQWFYHIQIPDCWNLGQVPPQNPAFQSADVLLQLSI
jgi:hypothetical protein